MRNPAVLSKQSLIILTFAALAGCHSPDPLPPYTSPGHGIGIGGGHQGGGEAEAGVDDAGDGGEVATKASFACGGQDWTCQKPDSTASCCEGLFFECPADYPDYCPTYESCWSGRDRCDEGQVECEFISKPCDGK